MVTPTEQPFRQLDVNYMRVFYKSRLLLHMKLGHCADVASVM